ncbi:HNH endonuclease [Lewinella sp. 4G2]|uniref:HNH endonuclease n=1 Tax=Lewinella sp. 4G2 TaxID=1803372 RepID=UPI0007DFB584|nr:hypothetical protein A3850_004280 [Lewinella sp. 4G2]
MGTNTLLENFRTELIELSSDRCEYCTMPQFSTFYTYHIEHVISRKQGGPDLLENLAYACPACNRYKGSSIVSYDYTTEEIELLFHPRRQIWNEHFQLLPNGKLKSFSKAGEGTIRILQMNLPIRVEERLMAISKGYLLSFS